MIFLRQKEIKNNNNNLVITKIIFTSNNNFTLDKKFF